MHKLAALIDLVREFADALIPQAKLALQVGDTLAEAAGLTVAVLMMAPNYSILSPRQCRKHRHFCNPTRPNQAHGLITVPTC
jgi:hypothetical protein